VGPPRVSEGAHLQHCDISSDQARPPSQLGYGTKPVIYEENEEGREVESDEVSGTSAAHVIAGDQEVRSSIVTDEVEVTGALNPLFSGPTR
jgi:hypothetical protein